MIVGVLRVRLAIYGAQSLKDKRRVVKSLKDRLAARHNISIAEVDDLDRWQVATIGLALVANDTRFVESALTKIMNEIRADARVSLLDHDMEFL